MHHNRRLLYVDVHIFIWVNILRLHFLLVSFIQPMELSVPPNLESLFHSIHLFHYVVVVVLVVFVVPSFGCCFVSSSFRMT